MPYTGNQLHYLLREELNQKNKDIETRYLITMLSRINQLSSSATDLYPAELGLSFEEGRKRFLCEMSDFMWNSDLLGCSGILGSSFFKIKSLDLQTEYTMEYSETDQEIILFLEGEHYSVDRYAFDKIELVRYHYNEYKKAVNLMEKINTIVLEEREHKAKLKRLRYEFNNPKLCEIAKTTIKAARISHKKDNVFIRSFCSNYQGYILISPDGVQLYVIFIVLKDWEKEIQTVLDLCSAPKSMMTSNNKIECIPINTRALDFEKLGKIERIDQILQAVYGNKLMN